jgi:sugar phosphate isomerase/epimerase
MIYVSTGGYKNLAFEDTIKELSKAGIVAFELSGGKFSNDALERLKTLSETYAISLHNYFPPPKIPFVLNLASFRDDIVQASMSHITHAIDISHSIGAKFYGFHAGYLIDPPVSELGAKITKQGINDRRKALDYFIARVSKLAAYAEGKGVKLLVENNVLSSTNYKSFGENPLLMVDEVETHEIMNRSHSNLGLLIDVAHLKVSANTLDFSAIDYLNNFYGSVSAYHFSDNLGLEDTNDEITEESWFWPYINKDLDYYSLEIYNIPESTQSQQLRLVSEILCPQPV